MSLRGDVVCRELVELLTDYLEDAIPPARRAAIDAHLADCDGCSNALDQLRRTILITGTLTPEDVPATQRDALLAAFRGR